MKNIYISFFLSLLLVFSVNSMGDKKCKSVYKTIDGNKYFDYYLCTEDLKYYGVKKTDLSYKKLEKSKIDSFFINNHQDLKSYIDEGGNCEGINDISVVDSFESSIYTFNGLSFSSSMNELESIKTSIETLQQEHDSETLFKSLYSIIKAKFPLVNSNFIKEKLIEEYADKQLSIKKEVITQYIRLKDIRDKLGKTQLFLDGFYDELKVRCSQIKNVYNKKNFKSLIKDKYKIVDPNKLSEQQKTSLLEEYKLEFTEKLGERLNKMPKYLLKKVSLQLLNFTNTSKLYRKLSAKKQEKFKLKIQALQFLVDEKIN